MQANRLMLGLRMLTIRITLATIAATLFAASGGASEKVIHNFAVADTDGYFPLANLVFDGAGNLYGTTQEGGSEGFGTVFEMTPNGSGGWTEKVLHNFYISRSDGQTPFAGLVFDRDGNIYGTTEQGGSRAAGVVFEMTPNAGGGWTERVIHNFGVGEDGRSPEAGLIFDGAGNLYGTTVLGGTEGDGTVFEMTPDGSGGWRERVIHNFGMGDDGQQPYASLIFDGAGNLYGTTGGGFFGGYDTVFEMTPDGSGGWTEKVIHNFGMGDDGQQPNASLIFDGAGNLYGTTYYGGTENDGTVFEMTPNGSGGWSERVLHNFGISNDDGRQPYAGLIFDGAGNLYGTTVLGGTEGDGTLFEMTPNGSGGWTDKVRHNFGMGNDGVHPHASLIFDGAGNLYGTTEIGGSRDDGTVFEVAP